MNNSETDIFIFNVVYRLNPNGAYALYRKGPYSDWKESARYTNEYVEILIQRERDQYLLGA